MINTMIEKIPGVPRLDKLRVIHIIESDVNLWMGIVWGRRLLHNAEAYNLLGDEQSGSRSGKKCQDVIMFKHATYSILRMAQRNGITFDNDAKSCYDRIVMTCASMIAQRLGLKGDCIALFIEILSRIEYHAKTYYGVSELYYKDGAEIGIHGPGQGGRASPAIWTIISCYLLEIMRETSTGARLISPYGEKLEQVSSGFVDDITHWCIDMTPDSEGLSFGEITMDMQRMAQRWEELLHITGGKLELSKCFYYSIFWKFDAEGVPQLVNPEEIEFPIRVQDSETRSEYAIKLKRCDEAHKTLGVMETPSGDYSAEHERLKIRAGNHANIIATSVRGYEETETYYYSIYIPSMRYSLVVGTLTEQKAQAIQSKVTQATLTGLGYNSRTPSEIVYGPKSLGGIGLRHLFTEQGMEKVKMLLQQIRGRTKLGRLLIIQLQWAQLWSGWTVSILEDNASAATFLETEDWIARLREFLSYSRVKLHIPEIKVDESQREHDRAIMEYARDMHLSPAEIRRINRCRIYLKVAMISDIANAEGSRIRESIYQLNNVEQCVVRKEWPHQSKPGQQHAASWRKLIRGMCQGTTLVLRQHLGKWHHRRLQSNWPGYYNYTSGTLLTTDTTNNIIQYYTTETGRNQWIMRDSYPADDWCEEDEKFMIPVDIREFSEQQCTISVPKAYHIKQPNLIRTWEEYCNRLSPWESETLSTMHVQVTKSIWEIKRTDEQSYYIVSDGSVSGSKGTYAWVFGSKEEIFITGQGCVNGNALSSYRAELYGIAAWLLYFAHYTRFLGRTVSMKIVPYCDNIAAVTAFNAAAPEHKTEVLSPEFDLVHAIGMIKHEARQNLDIDIMQHVKGHQDRDKKVPVKELSRQAQLNIEADQRANIAMRTWEEPISQVIRGNPIYITRVEGGVIHNQEIQTLLWRGREFRLQEYYERKLNITQRQLHSINWAALRIARDKMPAGLRKFSIKWAIDWLATGERMKKYGGINTVCPTCGGEETGNHLFTCAHRGDERKNMFSKLREHLQGKETASIMDSIIGGFDSWSANPELSSTDTRWDLAIRGLQPWEWAQQFEKVNTDSNKTGDSWQANMILLITQEMYTIWNMRNKEMHGIGEEKEMSKAQEEIISQVQFLYKTSEQMSVNDAHRIFTVPLEQRIQFSTETNREWIRQHRTFIKKKIQQWTDNQKQRLQDIRSFYSTRTNNNTARVQRQESEENTNQVEESTQQKEEPKKTKKKRWTQLGLAKWFGQQKSSSEGATLAILNTTTNTTTTESDSLLPWSLESSSDIEHLR